MHKPVRGCDCQACQLARKRDLNTNLDAATGIVVGLAISMLLWGLLGWFMWG